MPGGKIMVYTGLIDKLHLTDDELAVVLGHEIAHALREHSREQVSQAMAAQTAIGIGSALLGLGQGAAQLGNVGYDALIATRFSRTDEDEADRDDTKDRPAQQRHFSRRPLPPEGGRARLARS